VTTLNVVSFIGFTALVGLISYYRTKGTDETHSEGYFLGGRSLTAPVIAGSLMLTNLSTEQIVGLTGQAYGEGILVMAWETLAAIAMVVAALFLLPRYLKGGITTIPQYLADRFDVGTKSMVSALFLSGYMIVLMPIVLGISWSFWQKASTSLRSTGRRVSLHSIATRCRTPAKSNS
jgi:SSS family solute:Na+ symporter